MPSEESNELRDAVDAAGVGLWTWEVDGAITWNDAMLSLWGLDAAPADYKAYLETIHPDDREPLADAVREALGRASDDGGPGSYRVEHRVLQTDGSTLWIEGRGRVFADANGAPSRISGTVVDITRRKAAELALRESEERYRLYAELAADYAYSVDLKAPSLAPYIVAGAFEATVGLTPEQVAERGGWTEIIHPDDRGDANKVLSAVFQGRPAMAEYRIIHGDGTMRWFRDRVRPVIRDGAVVELRGVVVDITESRRMERQLLEVHKDEALVRFAGNAAHDFNNLLTVIVGSVELLSPASRDGLERELLDSVSAAANQASELTRGMLLFGRRMSGEPKMFAVDTLLEQAEPILRQGLGRDHQLVFEKERGLGSVRVDPGQAQLMLLNLVLNARKAMSASGTVEITARKTVFEPGAPRPAELAAGAYVAISVADEGPGIPHDVLPHVFEPFFTTRQPGEGTGLGLSAGRGVAQSAGGTIVAANQPTSGAVFTVYLPWHPADRESPDREPSMAIDVGGSERILVVDDDTRILALFARALRRLGYTIVEAPHAEAALEKLESETFDLVVSDIVMPGMGGVALAYQVAERWPETRVLLTSGNTDGASAGFPFLPKPATLRGLARRVREVLEVQ